MFSILPLAIQRGTLQAVRCSFFSGYRPPDFARAGLRRYDDTVHRWRGWPEGPGVDLLSFALHPPPVPLRRGTLQAVRCSFFSGYRPPPFTLSLSKGWRGWPASRAGGGLCCLGFSSAPCAPSEGGHLRCISCLLI